VEINSAWGSDYREYQISAKESLGYDEWFDSKCSKLLDKRKQTELQWLQDPSEINGDNLNKTSREIFRNKKGKI
jgi:hypothetical protein